MTQLDIEVSERRALLEELRAEFEIVKAGLELGQMKRDRGERMTDDDVAWLSRYERLLERVRAFND